MCTKKINSRSTDSNASEKITLLREYLGLSKNAFALRLGLSTTHISRLENGVTIPGDKIISNICETFGVRQDFFDSDVIAKSTSDVEPWLIQESVDSDYYDGLTIPERIKKLREKKGWTQYQLAEKADVSNMLISTLEAGKRKLTSEKAKKIADVFGVGVEYLTDGIIEKRDYPVNDKMINWLWENKDVRKEIWNKMSLAPQNF